MIALNRIRTVAAIKQIYRGADKKVRDKELMIAQRLFLQDHTQVHKFKATFWKKAKTQLKKESFGKCAYCEANAEVVAHGDVEHYRPKSIYWWLAYTYDNYLYACQICNQSYKSDNFPYDGVFFSGPDIGVITTDNFINNLRGFISPDPIDINSGYTLQDYKSAHVLEVARLPNPYFDDPTLFLAYEADDIKEEVLVIPKLAIYAPIVKAMEDYYGINRIELKNARYNIYLIFKTYIESSRQLPDGTLKTSVLKQLDRMIADKYLFAGMNRYFKSIL